MLFILFLIFLQINLVTAGIIFISLIGFLLYYGSRKNRGGSGFLGKTINQINSNTNNLMTYILTQQILEKADKSSPLESNESDIDNIKKKVLDLLDKKK